MSSLLKEAIVDAQALREAALKSAENVVMEKYSDEVRKTLDKILEQDEMDMELGGELSPEEEGAAPPMPAEDPLSMATDTEPAEEVVEEDEVPLGATDGLSDMTGTNLSQFPPEGENVEITVDLGALQEAVKELQREVDEEIEFTVKDLAEILSNDEEALKEDGDPGSFAGEEAEEDEDEEGASDSGPALAGSAAALSADEEAIKGISEDSNVDFLVDAIIEKLTVDTGFELSGWGGRPSSQLKHGQELELAHLQSDEVKEDLEDLNKAQEELFKENKQLKEQNNQYKQAINELREGLQDVNLSNARLLYTNRVLRNTSLNERQKSKIVEAISSAGSVTEARTIFETLQSTMEASPKRSPQSLGEAIGRGRASVIRASRHESTASDPLSDRMKKLAGIK
tara:strand:- start:123 stop:1319 length:1197 start_codon:yes stop_codon:yes gene_type:complete